MGTPQSEDVLVFKNDDKPDWLYGVGVTNDGKYALITTSKDTDRVNLLQIADISQGSNKKLNSLLEVKDLVPEWIGGFSYIQNDGPHFYFETNLDAPRGKIVMIDIRHPE